MENTEKIAKFFENKNLTLEENNARVQANHPNIPEPPKATTQAPDQKSLKVTPPKIISKDPIILGSPDAYRRVIEKEQKLKNLDNLDNRELLA